MPYADPQKRKESAARRYQINKHRWKHPDGSWKKANTNSTDNSKRCYYKNRDKYLERARQRTQQKREERTALCPVCGLLDVLVYDHDHQTGLFRSYICSPCNLALGHAKDNPQTLRRLAEYLDRTITS